MILSEMRLKIRRPTGTGGPTGSDTSVYDDDAVDLFANKSYADLLNRYSFREKEIIAKLNTVVDVRNYTMPDPHDGLRQIDILHPDSNQHTRLEPMSVEEYTRTWNQDTSAYGFPERYVRESCVFRLWPTPDKVYELTVRYWGILADLTLDDQTIAIPSIWEDPIIQGAIGRIFMDLGDPVRAKSHFDYQKFLIENIVPIQTKEEEDYHRAGVEVLGREY